MIPDGEVPVDFPTRSMLAFRYGINERFSSTKTPPRLPRLHASSPYAPVPAKRSRKRISGDNSPKEEKRASRELSVAGRVCLSLGASNFIPLAFPPVILMDSSQFNQALRFFGPTSYTFDRNFLDRYLKNFERTRWFLVIPYIAHRLFWSKVHSFSLVCSLLSKGSSVKAELLCFW